MRAILVLIAVFASGTAQAALLGRAPLTPGGTNYQAYYDDVQDITWTKDANLPFSTLYDIGGAMTWDQTQAWIASLNAAMYLGESEWRLPTVAWEIGECGSVGSPLTTPDCDNELAYLFYDVLGNTGVVDRLTGQLTGCGTYPPSCLTNPGPFVHVQQKAYWTNAEAWGGVYAFDVGLGSQTALIKNSDNVYAWAVIDGDPLAVVPLPAAAWLFGGAVGALGLSRRRNSRPTVQSGGARCGSRTS